MDEMRIKIRTKLVKSIIAKFISKSIYKKVGFKPEIRVNDLEVEMHDGDLQFYISLNGKINEKAFTKISQILDEED